MSASRLSAAAAEWTPAPPAPSESPAATAQPDDDTCWPSADDLHQWAVDDWYDGGDEQQQQEQEQQQPQLEQEDAVALLSACHPHASPALLRQLLDDCGGDAQLAATILCDVTFEERRERVAAAAAATGSGGGSSAAAAPGGAQARRKQESFALSLEQFPSLGGPSSSSSRSAAAGSSSSWAAKAASARGSSTGARVAPGPQQQQQQRLRPPQPVASTSGRQQAAAEVPWVETGAAVSQAYAQARAEARDHARVRNQCFMQATLAWQAGDKALAKELSAQGKAAAERMWAAHERAGSQIFSARNAQLPQQAGPRSGPAVIDLHGLHVQEARSLLPAQLAALAGRGQQAVVSVIVGAGKHTVGAPSARLGPAVEALLLELGYYYSQPQPGLLRVTLR